MDPLASFGYDQTIFLAAAARDLHIRTTEYVNAIERRTGAWMRRDYSMHHVLFENAAKSNYDRAELTLRNLLDKFGE